MVVMLQVGLPTSLEQLGMGARSDKDDLLVGAAAV